MRNQHMNTGPVAYDQIKPESLHIVTNGGSSYCKVYLNRIEADSGDFPDVMQRILERMGVKFTYDVDDMSLPLNYHGEEIPVTDWERDFLAPRETVGFPGHGLLDDSPTYDMSLDPISPAFDPESWMRRGQKSYVADDEAIQALRAKLLGEPEPTTIPEWESDAMAEPPSDWLPHEVDLLGRAPGRFPVVVFHEPTEWVDRNLATASWWDKYLIEPGVYEIEPVTLNHHTCPPEQAYYYRVRMSATLVESYRENRLLHHVTADHKTDLSEPSAITASDYWYRLWDSEKYPSLKAPQEIRGGKVFYPAGWTENRQRNS